MAAVAAGGRGAAAAPAARVRRRPPGRARRRRAPCSGAPQARLPCCYCFDSRRGNTTPIALLRALSRARGSILVCPVVTSHVVAAAGRGLVVGGWGERCREVPRGRGADGPAHLRRFRPRQGTCSIPLGPSTTAWAQ